MVCDISKRGSCVELTGGSIFVRQRNASEGRTVSHVLTGVRTTRPKMNSLFDVPPAFDGLNWGNLSEVTVRMPAVGDARAGDRLTYYILAR
jgi:hypothetical protein